MNANIKRRLFIKGSVAAGTLGAAAGAGLLTPQTVLAKWSESAFHAKSSATALKNLLGSDAAEESSAIKIKAPDIAENGAVVPVSVTSSIPGTESISILSTGNQTPLIFNAKLGPGAKGFVSTRIKMGKTGDVVAIVKANGKLYKASKAVKVTIGGCGG